MEELKKVLRSAIVRSKKQRFVVAFCRTVEADKSLCLNALMGRVILPSDGERHNSRTHHHILRIIAELPSAVWPCRLRHVEGQTVPELQFHAEPFFIGLKKLQSQYGQKMQNYRSTKNIFGALGSDGTVCPSLRTKKSYSGRCTTSGLTCTLLPVISC